MELVRTSLWVKEPLSGRSRFYSSNECFCRWSGSYHTFEPPGRPTGNMIEVLRDLLGFVTGASALEATHQQENLVVCHKTNLRQYVLLLAHKVKHGRKWRKSSSRREGRRGHLRGELMRRGRTLRLYNPSAEPSGSGLVHQSEHPTEPYPCANRKIVTPHMTLCAGTYLMMTLSVGFRLPAGALGGGCH